MLIVIALVSLAVAITISCLFKHFSERDMEIMPAILIFIFSSVFLVSLVLSFLFGGYISEGNHIDEQIELYESENREIEQNVSSIISNYTKYEEATMSGIGDEVNAESSIAVVYTYPELYSSELVKKQIEIYTSNREQIKELETKKIYIKVYKWWLYFGIGGQ